MTEPTETAKRGRKPADHAIAEMVNNKETITLVCRCGWTHEQTKGVDKPRATARSFYRIHKMVAGGSKPEATDPTPKKRSSTKKAAAKKLAEADPTHDPAAQIVLPKTPSKQAAKAPAKDEVVPNFKKEKAPRKPRVLVVPGAEASAE